MLIEYSEIFLMLVQCISLSTKLISLYCLVFCTLQCKCLRSLQSPCWLFFCVWGPCIFMCPMDASILSAHAKAAAWAQQKNLIDWPANRPRRRRSRRAPVDDKRAAQKKEKQSRCKNLRAKDKYKMAERELGKPEEPFL